MPSLTVKNIPDKLLKRLRQRAKDNHRSLQGELLYTLEHSAMQAPAVGEPDLNALFQELRALGGPTASSVALIREDRESR